MFARSRFQIGPSKQFQNNRCLALRRPPSCARQRCRFRRLLSRPPGSFRSPGIGSLCLGHAFPPSEHFLYKCSQPAVQRNSGPGEQTSRGTGPDAKSPNGFVSKLSPDLSTLYYTVISGTVGRAIAVRVTQPLLFTLPQIFVAGTANDPAKAFVDRLDEGSFVR